MARNRKIKPKTEQYRTLLESYQTYISILGYCENGRQIKHSNVLELLTQLEAREITPIKKVSPADIIRHYEYLKNRPHKRHGGVLSLKTISHHMRNIRVFFAFLQESGIIITNPMSTLKFNHPQSQPTQRTILTIPEIKELYQATETLQERVILSLAYGCGLRAMELSAVNMEDIRTGDGILIVPRGKGNKRRVIPMSSGVKKDLENYIENERDLYIVDEAVKALLLNIKGDRLQGYTCRKLLKKLIARAGNKKIISKEISTHNLRHSIATHLLEQGVPIEQVRNFLGHSHLETTEIYTRVNQNQLKQLLQ